MRGDAGSEKHAKEFVSLDMEKAVFKYFHLNICKFEWF